MSAGWRRFCGSTRACAIALVIAHAWPAAAAASSAVLLPALGGDAVSLETQSEVRALARTVLEGEGFTVFDAAEVSGDLPASLRTCGPADRCAFELRAVVGADVAVGLSVQHASGEVHRVTAILTGARGVAHRADAVVDPEAGLPFAVAASIRDALATWTAGRSSTPAPELAPLPEPALSVEPSAINWWLGGFLVLGSAPMLGYGINSAARDGECVREVTGGCAQRIRFQEGAAIFTGLGVAMLAAGIVMLVTHPIPVFVAADGESASLHARGTF